jgi:hypothetical protein
MCATLIVVLSVGIWVASLVIIALLGVVVVTEAYGLDDVVHKAVDREGFKNHSNN